MKDIKQYAIIRGLLVLLVFFIILPAGAEPVWSGNAAVDVQEFVNFIEDTPLAGASNSFTRNTVVEVTNPQNGRTIEITIVKRAPRPGIFLLISDAAGKALGFPSDQVIPVQVRVVNNKETPAYDSRFKSSDLDINPAVNLPSESVESVPVMPEEIADDAGSIEKVTDPEGDSFLHEPVPVPLPDDPSGLLVPEDSPPEDRVPGTEMKSLEGEVDVAVEETPEEPVPAVPEVREPEALPEISSGMIPETGDKDNVIYFLTPSDFRPPEAPAAPPEEEIVPVYVERDVLEDRIADQLSNGSSYIQLGAYSSAALVYSEMESIATRYPMVVWTEKTEKGKIYKLLIGPLTADETGVLVYRFKAKGYPDLFLYRP